MRAASRSSSGSSSTRHATIWAVRGPIAVLGLLGIACAAQPSDVLRLGDRTLAFLLHDQQAELITGSLRAVPPAWLIEIPLDALTTTGGLPVPDAWLAGVTLV